jgi:hypothetical protein
MKITIVRAKLLALRAKFRSRNPDFRASIREVRDLANEVGRWNLFRKYEPGETTPMANSTASAVRTHLDDLMEALSPPRATAALCALEAAILALG